MNLTVNGVDTPIESRPLTSLLDVLREELGITSPKVGCEQGGSVRAPCSWTGSHAGPA